MPDDEETTDWYLPSGVPLTYIFRDEEKPHVLDDTESPPESDYTLPEPTFFVISGPLYYPGKKLVGRGRAFTWPEAREWVTTTYGDIISTVRLPGRWAFKVPHPGRYTPPPEESLPERARKVTP